MIDFIKLEIVESNAEQLEQNPFLNFESHINKKTKKQCKCRHAFYNGLIFRITEPKKKSAKKEIIIEGSLHKYYNNGEHNFDDFTIPKIFEAISRLEQEFGFSRFKMLIKEIGIGVNINPPYNSRTIMNGCANINGHHFDWKHCDNEGDYKHVLLQNIAINFYDKSKHYSELGYKFKSEIIRFEIKILDNKNLISCGIHSIIDLFNDFHLQRIIEFLSKIWSEIQYLEFIPVTSNQTGATFNDRITIINSCSNASSVHDHLVHDEIMNLIVKKVHFLFNVPMDDANLSS